MKYLLNNNTVNEKLTNGSVDLEKAATGLDEVLSALDAIMPCLPGWAPLKVEYGKIKSAARCVRIANGRLSEILKLLPEEALRKR